MVTGDTMLQSIYRNIVAGGFEDVARALSVAEPDREIEDRLQDWLRDSGRRGDVCVTMPPGRAPAWPWESWLNPRTRGGGLRWVYRLANSDLARRETVRWVQRAAGELLHRHIVADGVLGVATRSAIQDLQNQFGLEPTGTIVPELEDRLVHEMRSRWKSRVAIVLPNREVELKFGRGYGASGIDLRALWESAGCSVEVLQSPEAGRLASGIDADIIHVIANLDEGRGEIRLWTHFEPLPSAALASGLKNTASRRGGRPPFVILDTPRPDSDHEACRQVALRNSLGDELFRQQTVSGILGCGLARESILLQLAANFISTMATAKMGEAAAVWWDLTEDPRLPAALFCHNPDLPAWYGGSTWA
jgi:hypothetical protein